MSCVDDTPLCVYIASFHDWKNVTLHAFTAHILTVRLAATHGNLVNFVYKDDSTLLDATFCFFAHFVIVSNTVKILFKQNLTCLMHRDRLFLCAAPGKHLLQIAHAFGEVIHAAAGNDAHVRHLRSAAHRHFDNAVFKFSFTEHLAEFFTSVAF